MTISMVETLTRFEVLSLSHVVDVDVLCKEEGGETLSSACALYRYLTPTKTHKVATATSCLRVP